MSKPCEYCGVDLPLGVDKGTRRQRSFHFASCEKRPLAAPHSPDIEAQRDALRRADLLEMGSIWSDREAAAAELRRLGLLAENERLKPVQMKYRRMEFNAQLQTENDRLRAQRDQLLETLKQCRNAIQGGQTIEPYDSRGAGYQQCFGIAFLDQLNAAIKAVEEGK